MMMLMVAGLSCEKKEDNFANIQKVVDRLVGKTWKVKSVEENAIDRTSIYTGMTIEFIQETGSRLKFKVVQGEPAWPEQGFVDCRYNNRLEMTRDDNVQCFVTYVSDNELEIDVLYYLYSIGPGREKSTGQKHTFKFSN